MTYKHLKSFIESNRSAFTGKAFDLISKDIKSKIIFAVGERASETADYLSSVMREAKITHSRFIDLPSLEFKDRFINNGERVPISVLSERAGVIIKKCEKLISNAELCTLLSLNLLAGESDYLILEMSDGFYTDTALSDFLAPHAVLLSTLDDTVTSSESELAAKPTAEIFTLSEAEDFDYISRKTNKNGVRLSRVSQNKTVKFRSDLLGTEFFYNQQEYRISSFDINNILPACLAEECARALFSLPCAQIHKGLNNTRLMRDVRLYSISPTVLLSERTDIKLDRGLKFKTVKETDGLILPTESTLYIGSAVFLDKIKNAVG